MLANERNEAQNVHLKEILEAMQVDMNLLERGYNGPSHEKIQVSTTDEVSMIQPVEDANLMQT